jgi:hypothetical protein
MDGTSTYIALLVQHCYVQGCEAGVNHQVIRTGDRRWTSSMSTTWSVYRSSRMPWT